jgi:DNA polymerase-3 subunit delta
VYIITGSDAYLLEDAVKHIKIAYKQTADFEERKLSLQSAADWQLCLEEANSYSIFSEYTLIDAYYDKKTFDAPGKAALNRYLDSVNPRCLILIRAAEIPTKQLQVYASNPHLVIVVASPLDTGAMQNWIVKQLQSHSLQYVDQVPEIIQQYTEGNMLACAQAIEKLALTADTLITVEALLQQLSDQSHYQLFDLSAAFLQNDASKAISILRHAAETRVEPTLILWVFSNEIRLLLQLNHKLQQGLSFNEACSQLKIWSTRTHAYQKMLKRLTRDYLQQLLKTCFCIDEQIKSSQTLKIWQNFESIALGLCLGN